MKCRFCRRRAGWMKRRCRPCRALWGVYLERLPDAAPPEYMPLLRETGASEAEIDAFLLSDPDGRGSIQDRIAAGMTNQILQALGSSARQDPGAVKRIRSRGLWRSYDQRPPD